MIRVQKVTKPTYFDKRVHIPGQEWLEKHPSAKRPKAYWDCCIVDLAQGFDSLCGYAAMLDPTGGTVDHYISFNTRRDMAYDWSNYRFASGTLNCSKQNADDTVLDPFEVGEGWFEILLPSLQMCATDSVPKRLRKKAEFTLDRLKLRDGERVIRWRQSWYEMFTNGILTLDGLRRVAPLIAKAVEKIKSTNGIAP